MTKDILPHVIKELLHVCKQNHVRVVLAGGIATSFWARPRATYDVDGIVELSFEKIQGFLKIASQHGFKPEKKGGIKFIKGMPFITILYSTYKTYVDLFIVQNDFQRQMVSRAKQAKLKEITIPVISCEDLILMKLVSGRDKDMEDIRDMLIENYSNLDFIHLKKWAKKLGVETFLKDELQSVKHEL